MENHAAARPRNVAAFALKAKARPFVVSSAPYSSPPAGHVAIAVSDVAINPIDYLMQETDLFQVKYPHVFGIDAAGVIFEVGHGVHDFHVGQRVIAWVYPTFYMHKQ